MEATVHTAPQVRLGKTALWIHGLGLLFLGAGITALAVMGKDNRDSFAILGVGSAAWIALTIWSLVIAIRSRKLGEGPAWRTALWMVGLLEVSVVFVLLWIFDYQSWAILPFYDTLQWIIDLSFEMCLPVLLPFLFAALCLALPLSAWAVRRGAQRSAALGKVFNERRTRRFWMGGLIAAQGLLILPWFLLPYSASTLTDSRNYVRYSHSLDGRHKNDPRVILAKITPTFIGDMEESILERTSLSSAATLRLRMIQYGFVSRERLLAAVYDSNPEIVDAACETYQRSYPEEALAGALKFDGVGSNQSVLTRIGSFGNFAGRTGGLAQIRQILDKDDAVSPAFRYSVLTPILGGQRQEDIKLSDYFADAIRVGAADVQYAHMFHGIDRSDPANAFQREWIHLFEQRNWSYRLGLADVAMAIPTRPDSACELFSRCLEDSDVAMRRNMVRVLSTYQFQFEQYEQWKPLLNAFDDSDIVVRRGAVWAFAKQLRIPLSLTPNEIYFISTPNFTPAAVVPGEEKELQAVRAAAKAWLKTLGE